MISRPFSQRVGRRPFAAGYRSLPLAAVLTVAAPAALFLLSTSAFAQSGAGTLSGAITDATGAALPGATVQIGNPVSGYTRTVTSDSAGQFRFNNLPYNAYRLKITEKGFSTTTQNVAISSSVPQTLTVKLLVGGADQVVNVEGTSDLLENDANLHTDIDRNLMEHLPLESASSELSSIVTLASPGVAADSNGLMHGLGDHAENSFSIDGQPITDQQSKVFSNQIPSAAVQSLEVIDGAPPAEYGDKTSLVVKATTRSGQGITTPTGSISLSYGSFGSANAAFDLAYGGKNWGNFIAASGLQTGRFLDAPEFVVMHDKGNEENFFDRADYQLGLKDSLHLNVQYTRSWFQTPNDYENIGVTNLAGTALGNTDQRSKIGTVDISPTWTHTINTDTVANFGVYLRRDDYSYYPSSNPLADFAPSQQQETVQQFRTLTNLGSHGDVDYVHGIHNAKAGFMYAQTFLRENDALGLVDPGANAPCVDANGNPDPGSQVNCVAAGGTFNTAYTPVLRPYDLTRGGSQYVWRGRTDVKQLALYAQDQLTFGNWLVNFGVRGDFYNGLTIQRQAEPRTGVSYKIPKTASVLRLSYARTQETPFNENLVLSSTGCADPVIYAVFSLLPNGSCSAPAATPFNPGFRNEFHAGFQQGLGKHLVVNAEYIWKYTHNAYDFSVLGTTPITFPIEWHNSKIPGFALSASLTDIHGFSARFNASSVAARFFSPQLGGVGATPGSANAASGIVPFRIDHDERFNSTTHFEYALPVRKSLFFGLNWRYDSGLVAGAAPCYNTVGANTDCDPTTAITVAGQPGIDLSGLTADQQFQAGLICNGVAASPTNQIQQCTVAGLKSNLLRLPGLNTEDADKNPSRVAPRNLFDMSIGDDKLAHFGTGERFKVAARVTAINVTNKYALYNFLSTFSGTHYVTPRTLTAQISLHF